MGLPRNKNGAGLRRALLSLATIVLAVAIAYFVMLAVSATEVEIGPVTIEFEARPSLEGRSVVALPPVGTLEADTHPMPVELEYSLKEIAVAQAGELTSERSPARDALREWRGPFERATRTLLIRVFAVAIAAAAILTWLIRRRWRWAVYGALTGLVTALTLSLLTWVTYDIEAFAEPRYSGSLAQAPELVNFSQRVISNLDRYGDQVPQIAASLYRTINELEQLPVEPPLGESIRILHVSDLHSSDAGASLLRSVADQYDVAAVIDTGDISELSLPFELDYPASFLPLDVPYVWISGNHDKDVVRSVMREIDGVVVLEGEFVDVAGLRLAGFPDPSSGGLLPRVATARELEEDGERITALLKANPPPPDILVVHDPGQARLLYGIVPLVLSGHTHEAAIEIIDGTVSVNAGTTGAGGFRGFEGEFETPSSLQVLYFNRDSSELIAVDTIVIYGFAQEFEVSRRVLAPAGADGG